MYDYQQLRPTVLTTEGQKRLQKIRMHIQKVLALAGVITLDKAMAGDGGDSWERLACVHFLEELGEIVEVTKGQDMVMQNRIYKAAN